MKVFLNHVFSRATLAVGFASALLLSGCSADFSHVDATAGPVTNGGATKVSGSVFGGQQPVNGATVQLWVAGTTGYGSTASPLGASVTTNSNGGFTLGTYSCPSNAYVYITASGGDPQIGTGSTTNPSIALMTALGACSSLTPSTFIQINEATTVAAVWAMAPFAKVTQGTALSTTPVTPADTFGTSATNLQGLANAMAVANILASSTTGASPGTNTSGNVANVEYWQVYTLADILALCVNSTGLSSTTCSPVVTGTTSNGTAPADTIQMALYLAQNPTKSTSLLSQVTGTPPFQPYSATVNDWTIGYTVPTGTSNTRWIAIDQFGNAWVTTSGANIYELSPTGNILATPTTYTLGGSNATIGTSYEVAVDTANNAWFTDQGKVSIVEMPGSNAAGVAPSVTVGTGISAGTGTLEGISIDGSNNIWASLSSSHVVGLLNGAYSTLVTGGPTTSSPFMIANDMSNIPRFGNSTISGGGSFLYALDSGGCSAVVTVNGTTTGTVGGSIAMDFTAPTTIGSTNYAAGAATPLNYIVDSACNNTTNVPVNNYSGYATPRVFMSTPYGIAFDNNNAMWVVNQNYTSTTDSSSGKYSLSKMAPQNYSANTAFTGAASAAQMTFVSIPGSAGGLNAPFYLAMDGASAAWVANSTGAGLSAFTNSGANISPSTGFSGGTCTASPCSSSKRLYSAPRGIAVDGSGNVWVANTSGAYVTVVVGAATPTVTPLSLGIKNGTLASAP